MDKRGLARDVDSWINERRIELDLQWDELAARVGISRQALSDIRKKGSGRSSNIQKLEDALGWTRGSIARIRAGGSPTVIVTAEERPAVVAEEEPPPVDDEMLESLRFIRHNLVDDVPAEEVERFLYSQFRLWGLRLQDDDVLWRTWHVFLAEERQQGDDPGTWSVRNVT